MKISSTTWLLDAPAYRAKGLVWNINIRKYLLFISSRSSREHFPPDQSGESWSPYVTLSGRCLKCTADLTLTVLCVRFSLKCTGFLNSSPRHDRHGVRRQAPSRRSGSWSLGFISTFGSSSWAMCSDGFIENDSKWFPPESNLRNKIRHSLSGE